MKIMARALIVLAVLNTVLLALETSEPIGQESTRTGRVVAIASPRDGVISMLNVTVGQSVKAGDLLGQLDDRIARANLIDREAKLIAAHADVDAALKTANEAKDHLAASIRILAPTPKVVTRAAKQDLDRAVVNAAVRNVSVRTAEQECLDARKILALHELRSSGRGTIRTILRRPGDAVMNLETVLEIELAE
jgi:multidrug efflux pump subunit AcrA (membrane-fusion protein)